MPLSVVCLYSALCQLLFCTTAVRVRKFSLWIRLLMVSWNTLIKCFRGESMLPQITHRTHCSIEVDSPLCSINHFYQITLSAGLNRKGWYLALSFHKEMKFSNILKTIESCILGQSRLPVIRRISVSGAIRASSALHTHLVLLKRWVDHSAPCYQLDSFTTWKVALFC